MAEVIAGLRDNTIVARKKLDRRIASGLWLSAAVIRELEQHPERIRLLKGVLSEGDLVCYTLNTFPFGDFHSDRVKEQVYLPDWADPVRLDYTRRCSRLLAELMPAGVEGSLSTVPLGFKEFPRAADFQSRCIDQLLVLAESLDQLHDETGQVIRLAIEPEPCCVLETTREVLQFFDALYAAAEQRQQLEIARRHLGVCYDVCHQAVEFEEIADSVRQLNQAEVRINKMHLTSAVQIDAPRENAEARQQLAHFVEPRYLHQTFARSGEGSLVHQLDLTPELCLSPPETFASASAWRVHFHVPVNHEQFGALGTTRAELKAGIAAAAGLDYAPHLEVETYTWGVLPGEAPSSLADGLVKELAATMELMGPHRRETAVETGRENRVSE